MKNALRVRNQEESGYLALITAIILSLILLGLTFMLSASGFFARMMVLETEFRRVSLGLAESCANMALLKLSQNYNYHVDGDADYEPGKGARVDVGTEKCYIASVTLPDTQHQRTINTTASFKGSFSNIEVLATVQDLSMPPFFPPPPNISIDSWVEKP